MKSHVKNRRILVTGAAGFIGSHLVKRLIKEGAEVHAMLKKDSDLFRLQGFEGRFVVWHADIRDYPLVRNCVEKANPQIIYHLAAFRDVKRDMGLIDAMIDINYKGILNLLRAGIEAGITLECFINTGTCEEYGDVTAPFHENQREVPVSPYSASKVAATYLCQMAAKTMRLPIINLRPFLSYGSFQKTDMFIPSLISHCIRGKDFSMTEGDQTREFNYIDDVIDAYLLAADCPAAIGEVINIGNGLEYRVRDVAQIIVKMMNSPIKLHIGALPKRLGETAHFYCNNEKAKRILGWSPKTALDEGLGKTIDWYVNYFKNNIARKL